MLDLAGLYAGELAALGAAILWAIASIVYGRVGEHIPPLELNLAKGVLALVMLGGTLLITGDSLVGAGAPTVGLLLLSGAVGIGMGDTAYFETLQYVGARRALLMLILTPPLTALIALVFLGEAPSLGAWAGIVVTVAGVAWVITERVGPSAGPSPYVKRGVLLGLLAAIAQAISTVLARSALAGTDVSPLWGAVLRLGGGTVSVAVWMALGRKPIGRWLKGSQSRQIWGRLLFAVFAGTYLAVWLRVVSFKLTTAGVSQTLFATSPLFVLPIAAWMGERLSIRAVLGALIALAGVTLLFGLG